MFHSLNKSINVAFLFYNGSNLQLLPVVWLQMYIRYMVWDPIHRFDSATFLCLS